MGTVETDRDAARSPSLIFAVADDSALRGRSIQTRSATCVTTRATATTAANRSSAATSAFVLMATTGMEMLTAPPTLPSAIPSLR